MTTTISRRTRFNIAFAAAALSLALAAAPASAAKVTVASFGGTGSGGGQLLEPGDVAVDQSTGQVYVIDGFNRRIQRFDADGNFEAAFGRDVIALGKPGDLGDAFETCTVPVDCQAGKAGTGADRPGGEVNTFSVDGLAVDQASGDLYLVDNDKRITQFSFADNGTPADPADDVPTFVRAFGWDVVKPGGTGEVKGNERQLITLGVPLPVVSGTFTITANPTGAGAQTTGAIAFDASAATVEAALNALSNVAPGDIAVSGLSGGPWTLDYAGAYAGLDVALLTLNTAGLKGTDQNNFNFSARIESARNGGGFEVCTVAAECQRGAATDHYDAGVVNGQSLAVAPPGSPVAGDLFLADTLNARVEQFGPTGAFKRAWGWGIDTGADQFEVCTAASLCQAAVPPPGCGFGCTPAPQNGQFSASVSSGNLTSDQPARIAVDSAGTVYASNGNRGTGSARLDRFDASKSTPAELLLPNPIGTASPPPGFPAGPLPNSAALGLEVDPGNDHLYYLGIANTGVYEIDATTDPDAPTLVGTPHLQGLDPGANVTGLGYGEGGDRLYVSLLQKGPNPPLSNYIHRVLIAADTPTTPPTVVLDPVSAITPFAATFSGEVTPNGPESIDTSYRFEYRKVGDPEWTQLPSPPVNLGHGESPVAIEQSATGLESEADYEVRLIAAKDYGAGTTTQGPLSFHTPAANPTVQTLAPQRLTDTEATLAATLNPNGQATAYRFEYVEEGEFQANGFANATRVPVPDGEVAGGVQLLLKEDIEGLIPDTTYRYRLLATNANGSSEGNEVLFTTTPVPSPSPQRGFEMVTPPFKSVRSAVNSGGFPGYNPNVGIPSLDGDTMLWQVPYFPLTEDVGAPASGDMRIIRRDPQQGWVGETTNTLGLISGSPLFVGRSIVATSGDMQTQPLAMLGGQDLPATGGLLPTEGTTANRLYTFRPGTGTAGYTPWLANPDEQFAFFSAGGSYSNPYDEALLNDDGTAMARWGNYRGLAEDPETPGDEDPSDDGPVSGAMVYLQRAADPGQLPSAERVLVNACTGSGASETLIPVNDGGEIGAGPCSAMGTQLTSEGGAAMGGGGLRAGADRPSSGPAATALSDDGRRVFFESPDPGKGTVTIAACTPATGAETSCPPQLYVRSYDSEGNPTVRWISRAQGVGTQKIEEMGAGVGFQGASRDGRYVYFKTNAPLLPSDPNGGTSITTGKASDASWDLYRYELPQSLEEDPANGTLTRISGGPGGSADPSTNAVADPGGGGALAGRGAPLRFLSDDGTRAYFVTTSPIAGADATPPANGSTTPGGTVGNGSGTEILNGTTARNLYLFDDNESGVARYRFIARIPFSLATTVSAGSLDTCASAGGALSYQLSGTGTDIIEPQGGNCFRGTPDGADVVFFSSAQLTADDNDEAGDVYLYDAAADRLSRVSAPPAGASPYVCVRHNGPAKGYCNADMGWRTPGIFGGSYSSPDTTRGWGGMRYLNIAKDADGVVSVFFESRSELLPADDNGEGWDVYQWRQGKLSLISRARPGEHSYFSGNSTDGEDVFIWTSDRIDPREVDPSDYDLYDARIGGGFPYTPPPKPCDVLALACEGAATQPPPTPGPSSTGFRGAGNPKPKPAPCRKRQVRRKGRCVAPSRKHRARHGKHRSKHHDSKGGRK